MIWNQVDYFAAFRSDLVPSIDLQTDTDLKWLIQCSREYREIHDAIGGRRFWGAYMYSLMTLIYTSITLHPIAYTPVVLNR